MFYLNCFNTKQSPAIKVIVIQPFKPLDTYIRKKLTGPLYIIFSYGLTRITYSHFDIIKLTFVSLCLGVNFYATDRVGDAVDYNIRLAYRRSGVRMPLILDILVLRSLLRVVSARKQL